MIKTLITDPNNMANMPVIQAHMYGPQRYTANFYNKNTGQAESSFAALCKYALAAAVPSSSWNDRANCYDTYYVLTNVTVMVTSHINGISDFKYTLTHFRVVPIYDLSQNGLLAIHVGDH